MGDSTKGLILTEDKNFFAFKKAFDIFSTKRDISYRMEFDANTELVIFDFVYYGINNLEEKRMLFVNFGCDSDFQNEFPGGSGIVLSLGLWGSSEEIISDILREYKEIDTKSGIYIDKNDCDDVGYVELENKNDFDCRKAYQKLKEYADSYHLCKLEGYILDDYLDDVLYGLGKSISDEYRGNGKKEFKKFLLNYLENDRDLKDG